MKKIFFRLLIINILPLSLYAAGYVPLVEIEGITSSSATNYTDLLVQYAKGLYRMGVGLAAALAVMMLIFGGFEYATTDAIGGKEEGKEKIRNAISGLLLALFSFLILKTIDERLINLNLDLGDDVVIVAGEYPDILNNPNFEEQDDYSAGPGPGDTPPEGANGTKVNIPAGIRVDSQGKQIDITMQSRLQSLASELEKNNIKWAVTEAYPPTRQHKAPCHQDGTCIDANFRSTDASPENVKKFLDSTSSAGLRAVYEVQSESERTRFINAGVPEESIVNLGNWITAPHFSVYSN